MKARIQLVLFCTGIMLFWAALYLFVPILAVYSRARGASLALIGAITGSYGITQLLLRIPLGAASDRLGWRKPFVLGGTIVAITSCLGLAWAPGPLWILLFRALSGVAASVWVTVSVLFAGFFSPENAVRAAGILSFLSAVGQMVSTTAGGWVADQWGWTAPFLGGAVLGVLSLFCTLPIGEKRARGANRPTWRFWSVATKPSLLMVSLLAALDQYAFHTTIQGFIPLYANELGASATVLGWLASATLIPYLLMSLTAAGLAARMGELRTVSMGLFIGFVAVFAVPWVQNVPLLVVMRVLHGVGRALVYPVTMGLSIKGVPQEERATAMGVFQAVYSLGMFAGPAFSGLIAQSWGLSTVFWMTGVLSFMAAVVALWISHLLSRSGELVV